jgi:hypothetical protein
LYSSFAAVARSSRGPLRQGFRRRTSSYVCAWRWRGARSTPDWPIIPEQQQAESKLVNFCEQRGVYLLHDAQGVVYVGRVIDQNLGKRLQ